MSPADPSQERVSLSSFWSRWAQDIGELKRDIGELRREMKEDLIRLAATKTDIQVSEGRWKEVQQDIADMKADIHQLQQQPAQQQQQAQQQVYNQKYLSANQQMALMALIATAISLLSVLITHVRFQ